MATSSKKPVKQKRSLKPLGHKEITTDIQIAAGMACVVLLSQQGIQSMAQILQGANDPAAAVAHAIFMALSKVREALTKRKMQVDPRIWIMGGGVLDRVIFEVMLVLAMVIKFKPAADSQFVHQVKSDVLDLMQDDEDNSESIKVLHDKGLPVPKGPPQDQDQDQDQDTPQAQQGLAAPQGQPQQQAPQGAPQMMGAQ